MAVNFLSRDGYINTEEFIALAREIDKFATGEKMKPGLIYFSPKIVPKYDSAKAKAGGAVFEKKRAQVIKTKTRAPAAGSRMKMVVQLRLYKGIEDPEIGFAKDINAAIDAIEAHNKLAERKVAQLKKEGAKNREALAKAFETNLAEVEDVVAAGGIPAKNIVVGTSMMGKTVIVKLANGGYVSIGKSDAEKFAKARESQAEEAPARGGRSRAKVAPAGRSRSRAKPAAAAPSRSRSRAKVAASPSRSRSRAKAAAPSRSRAKVAAPSRSRSRR